MISREEIEVRAAPSSNAANAALPPLVLLTEKQLNRKPTYLATKRFVDLFVASMLLLLFFPIFIFITGLILVKDGCPVLFKHRRIGREGKEFYVLKFRTMRTDAEEFLADNPHLMEQFSKSYKLDEDPRVTPLGKWLRAFSLDELPQLINVFRGEMSLVGPRPVVEAELEKYGPHAEIYFSMKPGCAGLWQCSGRSDTSYDERVQMDVEYARKASFIVDAQIFFCTIVAVFRRQGAR